MQTSLIVLTILAVANGLSLSQIAKRATNWVSKSTVSDQYLLDTKYSFPQTESDEIFPMPQCKGIVLEEATIDQLQTYMAHGKLTAQDVVQCYINRYYQINGFINGIMELNPDALKIAASLDKERAQGKVRGPLHGIPFLVKDNFATKDKMGTTCGSCALLGAVVPRDAFVVTKLREAGAVLLGHATLTEWASMRSNSFSGGYSCVGGQTRSPYNLTINMGSSSSGSGASVAANMAMFALGTETDGSIIGPGDRNSLFGLKSTVGLFSRDMIVPESEHQDTPGPLTRTVKDGIYVMQAMYGVDPRDEYTKAQIGKTPKDGNYLKYLSDKKGLKGAKFGLPWARIWEQTPSSDLPALLDVLEKLKAAGATIYNNTDFKDVSVISPSGWDWDYGKTRGRVNESEFTVVKVDFYNNIKTFLAQLNNTDMKSLEDIVAYNNKYTGSEGGIAGTHPAFKSGQDSFLDSLAWKGIKNETYYQAVEFCKRTTGPEGIDYALNYTDPDTGKNFQLDALLMPSSVSVSYQQTAQAGYPFFTVPVSTRPNGRPFGIGLVQTAFGEPKLITMASAIEDLLKARVKPQYKDLLAKNIPVIAA